MADIESNIKVNIDTSNALEQIKLLQSQISAFHTQMGKGGAQAAAQAAQLRQSLINGINATGNFSAQMTTVRTSTDYFTNALERNKLTMGEYFRYAGGASKTFGKLFKTEFETIGKVARERVKDLQTQYIKMGRDASGAMQAIKVRPLMLDMDNLGTKTAIAAQKQQLLNQLLKQGSTNLLNFGKNTQWAGRQLMVGFTVPLAMLGSVAIKSFKEMEEAVVKFKRVYGDFATTSEETNKMAKELKTLAETFTKYGVAVKDTMDMAATAAAAGNMGADLLAQVSSATKLAVLGGVQQQQALETTISLTNAFGLSAEELAKKIDFLNAVENQTVVSIEDLTIAIPKAGPVVQQLGGDVEDLAFFLTAMKEGGINASEGANALKSGLASLINPTGKASEMLASFGINVKAIVEGNKGDIKKTVVGFAKALDTLDPLNRARAIEQMFGKFQFARLSTLFKNVVDQSSQASKTLSLTKATTEELAILSEREMGKMSNSPLYKYEKAMKDFQNAMVPIGEQFLKAVTPILDFVNGLLKQFNNLGDGTKGFITTLVAGVAGIGPIVLMVFGLIANGVANLIKLFANFKSFFNNLGKSSKDLGSSTKYMTSEQIEAAAVAASLDQVHGKLTQTFTSEAKAIQLLVAEYQKATAAQATFSQRAMVGGVGGARKYANGGIIVGPGTGTSDSIVARLSNGEAVIPAQSVSKHPDLVKGLISGDIPGYAKGMMPGYARGGFVMPPRMWQREIGPQTQAAALASEKKAALLEAMHKEVLSSQYASMPVTKLPKQLVKSSGNSFITPRIGGIYQLASGEQVFIKPQPNLTSALAELRGTKIAREAHGLIAPEQTLRVILDPTDPNGKRTLFALESKLNEQIANPGNIFTRKDYFKQLTASLLRGDKDLGPGNLGGSVLADVGPSGVFARATRNTEMTTAIPSMEEQAMINLLGVKGGAKKFFAQATSGIAREMSPTEYKRAMLEEIEDVLPRLKETVDKLGLTNKERPYYEAMIARLEDGKNVDWSKFQQIHASVPSFANGGMISGPGSGTSDSIIARVSNGEAIIPASSVAKNPDLVRALVSGNIPGFVKGTSRLNIKAPNDPTREQGSHLDILQSSSLSETISEMIALDPDLARAEAMVYELREGENGITEARQRHMSLLEATEQGYDTMYGTGRLYGGTTIPEAGNVNLAYNNMGIAGRASTIEASVDHGRLADQRLLQIQNGEIQARQEHVSALQELSRRGKASAVALANVTNADNERVAFARRTAKEALEASLISRQKMTAERAAIEAERLLTAQDVKVAALRAQGITGSELSKKSALSYLSPSVVNTYGQDKVVFAGTSSQEDKIKFTTRAAATGTMEGYTPERYEERSGDTRKQARLVKRVGPWSGAISGPSRGKFAYEVAAMRELAKQDGLQDGQTYVAAKKSVTDKPQNDSYVESRNRNSPHTLAGPDGAQDGVAYNQAKKLKNMELGVSEAEQSRLFSENLRKLEASEGYAEGTAHKNARVAVQRQENAEVLALVKEANAAELAAMQQQNAAIMATDKTTTGGYVGRRALIANEKKEAKIAARKEKAAGGAGRGMGVSMALSMLPMAASAMPGSIGKAAQDNMMPLMMLSMLPMFGLKWGSIIAALGAIVMSIMDYNSTINEARDKQIELSMAVGTSAQALVSLSKAAGKVTAGEIMDRRRSEQMGVLAIQPGQHTFGESFIQSEAGKSLLSSISKNVKDNGSATAASDLAKQMSAAVMSGAMSMDQARSSVASIATSLGNRALGIKVIGTMTELLGPNGENLSKDAFGLKVRLDMVNQDIKARAGMQNTATKAMQWTGKDFGNVAGMTAAGAGGGAAIGAGIGAALTSWLGPGAAIGAGVGAVIGTIAGGLTGFFQGMKERDARIAKFGAAYSAMDKNSLEQNKQILDSFDLQYQQKRELLIQQGKINEAVALENKYYTQREKLVKATQGNKQSILDNYMKNRENESGLAGQYNTGVEKQIERVYKDTNFSEMAQGALDAINSSELLDERSKMSLKLSMEDSTLNPEQILTLLEMFNTKESMDAFLNIDTKFGSIFSAQAMQVMGSFIDENGKPMTSLQNEFMLEISTKSSKDATRLLNTFATITSFGNVIPTDISVRVFEESPTKVTALQKVIDGINNQNGKIGLDVATRILGGEKFSHFAQQAARFTKLTEAGRKVFIAAYATELQLQGDPDQMEAFRLWQIANKGKGPTDYFTFAGENAEKIAKSGIDLTTSLDGGLGTDTAAKEPQASFLDAVVKSYRDIFDLQQKLTVGFDKSKTAIDNFAIRGFNGLLPKLAAAGVGPELMRAIIDAPQSEIDQIVDKTSGKIKKSFLKTLPKVMAAMNPFSKQNIAAKWLTMTEDEKLQQRANAYQAGLDVIKYKEDAINEKYDERVKALEKIEELNNNIGQQEEAKLSLADALSRGDIAAAAQAAQKMKETNRAAALEATKQSLENARKAELEGLTFKFNGETLTRLEAEERIEEIAKTIAAHKKIQLEREILIGDELDRQVAATAKLNGGSGANNGGGGGGNPGGNPGGSPGGTPTKPDKGNPALLSAKQIAAMKAKDPNSVTEILMTHSLQWRYMQTDIKDLTTKIADLGEEIATRVKKYPFVTSVNDSEKDIGNPRLNPDEQRALYEYRVFSKTLRGYEADKVRIQRDQHALGENGPGYYAAGGHIKGAGTGTSDSIPAMLSNGEYVIRANAVKSIGVDVLDKLNQADRMKFAVGGLVPPKPTIPTGSKGSPNRSINTDDPKLISGKLDELNASIESARTRLADADPKDTGRILILKQQLARAIAALSGYTYVPPAMPSEDMMKTFKNPRYKEKMGQGNGEIEYFNRYPTLADFIKYKTNRLIGGRTKLNSNGEYIYSPNGKPFEWMKDTFYGNRDKTLMSILGDAGYMHTWNLFGRDVAPKMPYEKLPGIVSDMGVIARDASNWQVYRARQMRLAGIHGGSDNWITQINSDLNYDYYRNLMKKSNGGMVRYANGGMVIPRFKSGGYVGMMPRFGDGGLANLHTGEYVFQKAAVDRIGVNNLNSMNEGVAGIGDSVYNYNINLNVSSMSNQDDIADAVLSQIKRLDSQRIRRTN